MVTARIQKQRQGVDNDSAFQIAIGAASRTSYLQCSSITSMHKSQTRPIDVRQVYDMLTMIFRLLERASR
jgi:hypothetical protein